MELTPRGPPFSCSYHFLRLLIRAPSATDPVLGISSLAILARSATLLLQHYERIFLTTHYVNCAWTVFARIVGAGHVVLQALWRGEMIRLEAAELMGKVLWFLSKLETRWTETAALARKNFLTLMDALGTSRVLERARSSALYSDVSTPASGSCWIFRADLEAVAFVLSASLASHQPSPSSSTNPMTDHSPSFASSLSAPPVGSEQIPNAPTEPLSDWPLDNGLFDDTWMLGLAAPPTDRAPAPGGAEWWPNLPALG